MASPDTSQLVGNVLGGYRILTRIGSGSMGHVYEAEHLATGRRVGLKVLHRQHQEEFAARFLREGKTLRLLDHPHIVELVEMGQLENGLLFLATELIDGKSLREVMDAGPMPERRALAIVRQVLDALEAAHELGVVHRDIKPENIMIRPNDYVKVLDFGVAKLLQDTVAGLGEANLTSVGFSVFGSALYIAPECVVGKPVDARIDIYSLGAVLYEMLTGKPPYDHPDPTELFKLHAFGPLPKLADAAPNRRWSPDVEYVIERALAKEPEARFRSASEMIAVLDAMNAQPVASASAPIRSATPPRGMAMAPSLPPIRSATPPRGMPQTAPSAMRSPATAARENPPAREGMSTMKLILLVGGALTVLAIVGGIALAMLRGSGATTAEPSAAANTAKQLIAAGSHQQAVELLEKEVGDAKPHHGSSFLLLGHARFAVGRRVEALGAYERALRATPELGADSQLRTNLNAALDGKDSLAAVLALELLAAVSPPAHDAILSYASTGKLPDARHRAILLAEREGLGDKIDRVEALSLDLQQATSCDERKAIIERLAATADKRALAALKRAKATKCVEHEATEAIAKIEAGK